ncbi:MAG: sulfite exporter TauE/SafE family protein [Bacteroidota bacterium]
MSWIEIAILIVSGVLVGFINTLAGGGTVISFSVFMFGVGLPADIANGTNRIAVAIQNIVSVVSFRKQKILDFRKAITLAIPAVIGSVLGAKIAVDINEEAIRISIGIVMLIMLFFILYNPEKWLKGQPDILEKKISIKLWILFFIIGIYGGYVHVGVGYFLLSAIVLGAGYDVVKGNAIKSFIVLAYTPASLLVFMLEGKVNYQYGLVHSIGNVIGAYYASKYAVTWGAGFVRWVIVTVIIIFASDLLGIIDLKMLIGEFVK